MKPEAYYKKSRLWRKLKRGDKMKPKDVWFQGSLFGRWIPEKGDNYRPTVNLMERVYRKRIKKS
jgi:hypothetical protein